FARADRQAVAARRVRLKATPIISPPITAPDARPATHPIGDARISTDPAPMAAPNPPATTPHDITRDWQFTLNLNAHASRAPPITNRRRLARDSLRKAAEEKGLIRR